MPYSTLQSSPLVPGASPVRIHYRDAGKGTPLVLLHGGWGYEMYPFDQQIETLSRRRRILIPDRSGYGRSTRLTTELPADFHFRAATETLAFLDEQGIERADFWGHSDGAVIAAILGFTAPERVGNLILEAFHYYRVKPASRRFFDTLAERPEALGAELCERFAQEHGDGYWRQLITTHAKAWLQIAKDSTRPDDDLYGGRLHEISAPTLFIHGRLDPRTEPGELDAVRHELPHAEMEILDEGAHSPHNESATAELVTRSVSVRLAAIV
jgi:pimeloyl-ACP methyl ester carboxylesterase